ncbi:hypothetical protein [Pseudomonas sp. KNUC1026]|uniref:hypothetical protein n=1 Tax=Pseudomonas sp. KNUC1026 TaxID=2893890 RepID=UPI001F2EB2F5|nr:hypothetical protein [Pseudomonas sp. KNUC1026]UFH48249.1 hypothetical protein LN139_13820 [Pseudomonas sp. KNUC1026]
MIGVVAFYIVITILSFRNKLSWLSLGVFIVAYLLWSFGSSLGQSPDAVNALQKDTAVSNTIGAKEFGDYKLNRAIKNLETGNIDDLSTGRMAIYREAIKKLDWRTAIAGCGFCNLKSVYGFGFSSLHNIFLTAVFKGGLLYAIFYCGGALFSLILLWRQPASFSRSTCTAAVASLALQGMVNDDLFFQVIPVLLFGFTGFLIGVGNIRKSSKISSVSHRQPLDQHTAIR